MEPVAVEPVISDELISRLTGLADEFEKREDVLEREGVYDIDTHRAETLAALTAALMEIPTPTKEG